MMIWHAIYEERNDMSHETSMKLYPEGLGPISAWLSTLISHLIKTLKCYVSTYESIE